MNKLLAFTYTKAFKPKPGRKTLYVKTTYQAVYCKDKIWKWKKVLEDRYVVDESKIPVDAQRYGLHGLKIPKQTIEAHFDRYNDDL